MTTVFILLDAFRPDYINKAPFIERLSRTSLSGTLVPPFGFMSTSGAIFAGLEPEKSNLCHKFCLAKESRPFNFIKNLPGAGKRNPLEPAGGAGKLLLSLLLRLRQRKNAISYYGSTEMIPFGLLPLFDFGQKKRPDEEGFVPLLSLFDVLRKEKKRYLYLGFARPRSFREYARKFMLNTVLKDRYAEDEYLVKVFKKDIIRDDYDFIYLHLDLLDSLGHSFGPGSIEMAQGIKNVDKWVEEIYSLLKARLPSLNFVLASDHGMTEVKGTVNLWDIILKSGLKAGTDFIPFLDATQARFWGDSKAIDCIRDMLAVINGGRFLTEDDIRKFGLRFRDNRYGDLFWVCEEGIVLLPNFFNTQPLRGAHGYMPGTKSDYAFFLINSDRVKKGRKEDGSLKDIFPSILRLMDLPLPSNTQGDFL